MKWLINLISFIVYLALVLLVYYVVCHLIMLLVVWLATLKMIWMILFLFFAFGLVVGLLMTGTIFISNLLNKMNPYPKAAKIIVIPLVLIFGVINLIMYWQGFNLDNLKGVLAALSGIGLILYITLGYISSLISTPEY